jgi:hypothetical protein
LGKREWTHLPFENDLFQNNPNTTIGAAVPQASTRNERLITHEKRTKNSSLTPENHIFALKRMPYEPKTQNTPSVQDRTPLARDFSLVPRLARLYRKRQREM